MRGKKLLAYGAALALSVVAIAPTGGVFAADNHSISDEAALASCLSAIGNNTCWLDGEIAITNNLTVPNGANTTLNLNGHNLTVSGSFVGNTGRGMITVENGGLLNIISQDSENNVVAGKITTEGSSVVAAVRMTTNTPAPDATKTAELTVNNGVSLIGHYYAITGNGSRHNTKITINGGLIKGTNDDTDSNLGIFHPQDGELIINGGIVEGNTGIEMRAGKLTVEDGATIRGLKNSLTVQRNDSGSTTDGAGIAIAQHNTLKNIDVTIDGGNIEGYYALYESNPQNNAGVEDKVAITVNDGTFKAINGGTVAVYSADSAAADSKVLTVNGGKFSSQPANFTIEEGFGIVLNDGMYEVKKLVDLDELDDAISDAENKEEYTDEVRNYTAESWNNLQNALTDAKTTRDDISGSFTNSTLEAIVTEKTDALNDAIDALEAPADLSELEAIVEEAEAIDETLYTEESVENLKEVLEAAASILESDLGVSKQETVVNPAVEAIETAIAGLVEKPEVEAPETGILTADNNSAARSLTSTIATVASGAVIVLGAILTKIFKSRKNC